jgi:hypothetical protein
MDTPHKYPRTYHWPWSPEIHKDDSTHQNPACFLDVEVVISEKLDGGNTCLWRGEAYARSTGQVATAGWFAMVKKHHAWKTAGLPGDLQIYGEDLYGIHSLHYDAVAEDQTYRVFNIREGDDWMSWDNVITRATELNMLTVPELFRGTFNQIKDITDWMNDEIKKPSFLGPEREGFVIRHSAGFTNDEFQNKVAKYVRQGHVQTNQHWTKNWQPIPLKDIR